jgi:hypothetical protein
MDNPSEPTSEVSFDDLKPQRSLKKNTLRILDNAPSILEARARGVPWTMSAARLTEAGMKVTPDYLRAIIERYGAKAKAPGKAAYRAANPVLVERKSKATEKPPTKTPTKITTPTQASADDDVATNIMNRLGGKTT